MQLLQNEPLENILPFDGMVKYFGCILTALEAVSFEDRLIKTIDWKNDEAVIFGKHFITKRKVAWYGDSAFPYSYSNFTRNALQWTPELLSLRTMIEARTGHKFNSCLLNLYHNGDEGMAWHSDDEKSLVANSSIASLSLGAARRFLFRHKQTKATIEILLENGSLLEMMDATQHYWHHSLPKSKKITSLRINLTFRTMA